MDLELNPITDAGLKHLAGLTELQSLNLDRTGVTSAGLKALAGFKRLQSLRLPGRVTDAAIAELHKTLPLTTITPGRPPFTM